MKGQFNICKSLSVISHINKLNDKNHTIISLDAVKVFNKIQHHLMIKVLERLGIKGTYLRIINAVYRQLKWRDTQSNYSETSQGCSLFPYPFNIVLEILARTITQLKKIKGVQIGTKYCYLQIIR